MAVKTKVLFLIPSLACGGTEKVMSTLINHWDFNRYEILLGINSPQKPFYKINSTEVRQIFFKERRVRYTVIALISLIWKERPNVIFSVLDFTKLLALIKPLIPKSCKLIARESNYSFEPANNLQRIFISYLFTRFDYLIVQSHLMKRHLLRFYPEMKTRAILIPNPLEMRLITKLSQDPLPFRIPSCPIFITIARLDPVKGHLRILQALQLIKMPFCYFIVGEGDERLVIEKYILSNKLQDKVILTGELKNPFPLLKKANVYLQGSYSEAFPNVLLEALFLEITPVAFDIPGGTTEIIHSGENGFLAKDSNDFANCITEVLKKPSYFKNNTQNLDSYSLETILNKYFLLCSNT